MKIKFLSRSTMRMLLILAFMANVLFVPVQSVSAQPLFTAYTDCTNITGMPEAECDALVALYKDTDGVDWTTDTDWLKTTTPCSWYGVTCLSYHVVYLKLNSNLLNGTISPELGDLTRLQDLDLSFNQLDGTIPAELGSLSHLISLNLSHNLLTEVIPADLGYLPDLQKLYLNSNELSDVIPPDLGSLSSLIGLDLSYNQLSGHIPPELGNLTNLTVLSLFSNLLTGSIPGELGNMANLQYLYLDSNKLSGSIPVELGNLANLINLSLYTNKLTGSIPAELGNLTTLQYLYLYKNKLSGEFPASITNLVDLEKFEFDFCAGLGSSVTAVVKFLNEKAPGWNACNLSISGNAGVGGAKLSYMDGATLKSVTADANGNYTLPIPYFWSGTVTPSRSGSIFTPVNKSYIQVITVQSAQNYKATTTFKSDAAQDGWVLESTETSNVGRGLNSTGTSLRLGDDNTNRQYRSILSFKTGFSLPDNAVITKVTLRVKKQSITGGGDPIADFQGIKVDIKTGYLGLPDLQSTDFETAANKTLGPISPTPVSDWYSLNLTNGKDYINKTAGSNGLTQIRLYFKLDDDNNTLANYLSLFSSDAPAASRPQLIIEYDVP